MNAQRKFNKEVVEELIGLFSIEGVTYSTDQIVENYLGEPQTTLSKLTYTKRAKRWILSCKRHFKKNKEFLTIVRVDEDNVQYYGLVDTEAHARVAFHQYYRLATGIVNSVQALHKTVQTKHLLPGEVRRTPLLLPKMRGDK